MRKGPAQPIADVLKNVVTNLNQAQKQDAAKILSRWSVLVGKGLAQHTRPVSLRRGTLQVLVDESAWLYQATLQKEKIFQSLKRRLGQDRVQDIQFRIGKI